MFSKYSVLSRQWFSTGAVSPPRGHLATSGDTAVAATGLSASGAWRPGTLLNVPRGAGQPHDRQEPASKVILHAKMGNSSLILIIFFIYRNLFNWRLLTLQYCIGFAIHQHESATGVHVFPIPNPPYHLPPHTIPLGHPSAPAPSILYHVLNLDWRFISYMILYLF